MCNLEFRGGAISSGVKTIELIDAEIRIFRCHHGFIMAGLVYLNSDIHIEGNSNSTLLDNDVTPDCLR